MIYKELYEAKNGSLIPIFASGKPVHSKYNPQKEAETLINNIQPGDFFVILGIGAGFIISEILKKYPDSKIIAVEETEEDLIFLKNNFPTVKNFENTKNIQFSVFNTFHEVLLKNYIPAIYSNFVFYALPSWALENPEKTKKLIEILEQTLEIIKKDFSVQAHFGKIWTKNILQNLGICKNEKLPDFPLKKTAVICAAGPSLEKNLQKLQKQSKDSYIIATDTAYKILLRNKIRIDAVYSVDGQYISINHFMKNTEQNPLFVFALSGNHSIAKKLQQKNNKVIFAASQNPLEQLACLFNKKAFIEADTSSGTVTVAAADFAKKIGFKNIEIYGADFSYPYHKAYSKGSYLDDIYQLNQFRNQNYETAFSKLVFRTELIINSDKIPTTEILNFYHNQLYNWAEKNNCKISKVNEIYTIIVQNSEIQKFNEVSEFDKIKFKNYIKNNAKKLFLQPNLQNELVYALLPLISSLKFSDTKKGCIKSFDTYLKNALNFIIRNTEKYE